MAPVAALRDRLVPLLTKHTDALRAKHHGIQCQVWDSPVGSLTTYQGHDFGIDCLIESPLPDEPDNVALTVGLRHLDRQPLLDAGVCWGHPKGISEADLWTDPVEYADNTADELFVRLPELFAALDRALTRGHPVELN